MNIEFCRLGLAKTKTLALAISQVMVPVVAIPTVTVPVLAIPMITIPMITTPVKTMAAVTSSALLISAFAMPSFAAAQGATSEQIVQGTKQLNTLILSALSTDSLRKQVRQEADAVLAAGLASATLMDPKLKVGLGGVPVDSFALNDDPMTTLSVGLMQQFERGETLTLKEAQSTQQAQGMQWQIESREWQVADQMTQLWLELGYLQYAETALQEHQRLLGQMKQFVQTNYAIGNSEAQDLIQIEIQSVKLDEQRHLNLQQQQKIMAQLGEWLSEKEHLSLADLTASYQLDWTHLEALLTSSTDEYALLNRHPNVQTLDARISVQRTQVKLAKQAYQPQLGVEVMYAHRQANGMMGDPASDLISAYVTLDLPFFTEQRQDKQLEAAQYQVGAVQYQKDTLLTQMRTQVSALVSDKSHLIERIARYQQRLIPQVSARIEAIERGYQNNTAQYSDMITASQDLLAFKLELARLQTDLNQTQRALAALVGGFAFLQWDDVVISNALQERDTPSSVQQNQTRVQHNKARLQGEQL